MTQDLANQSANAVRSLSAGGLQLAGVVLSQSAPAAEPHIPPLRAGRIILPASKQLARFICLLSSSSDRYHPFCELSVGHSPQSRE